MNLYPVDHRRHIPLASCNIAPGSRRLYHKDCIERISVDVHAPAVPRPVSVVSAACLMGRPGDSEVGPVFR